MPKKKETVGSTKKASIQAPWVTYHNYVKAMFGRDEEINIHDIEKAADGYKFIISSTNSDKLSAISSIFRSTIFEFGNVKLHIDFRVENDEEYDVEDLYNTAFEGNPVFDEVIVGSVPSGEAVYYVMFAKEVIQFFNDDLSDPYGNYNGLAEDIARDLFKTAVNVNFATSKEDPEE